MKSYNIKKEGGWELVSIAYIKQWEGIDLEANKSALTCSLLAHSIFSGSGEIREVEMNPYCLHFIVTYIFVLNGIC